MDGLISKAEKILQKMEQEGRRITLSTEATAKIDRKLSVGFTKIKEEYERKQRQSEAFMRGKIIS